MALVIASCGMLAAEDAKPRAKTIPLSAALAGVPGVAERSAGERTHEVGTGSALATGKSPGKHSTEDHEELVVGLSGHGQMALANGSKIDISPRGGGVFAAGPGT